MNKDGYRHDGWLQQGKDWYYMKSSGVMATGYQLIDGVAYYFYDSGVMLTNATLGSGYVGSDGVVGWDCFDYLAGSDYRSIRREYSNTTTARGAYIQVYTDCNGDFCVLVVVKYKIISNYSETFLHNLTKGKTIKNPGSYYDLLAQGAYGASRIHYLDQKIKAMRMEIKAQESGRFVSAAYLEI